MFTLPALSYGYAALEPVIGAATMLLHYSELHRGYVDRLNKIVSQNPELKGLSLAELINLSSPGGALAFNAGGHFNHSLLWRLMTSRSESGKPLIDTVELILSNFSSVAGFRLAFEEAARSVQGSGWVWAAITPGGELVIVTLKDQETLIPSGFHPVFGIDLWEHAYLLDYRAKRDFYITRFWTIIDWKSANQLVAHFFRQE